MFAIDWSNMQVYHYLAMGGGGLTLLAIVLAFILPSGGKLPASVASTLTALAAGIGIGVIGMASCGYQTTPPDDGPPEVPPPFFGGLPKAKGMPEGKNMPDARGSQGPSSTVQLAVLVIKLEQLTTKPLAIRFSENQRALIAEHLKGLAEVPELDEADAKKRLESILDVVKNERSVLEAAGYPWPGSGFMIPVSRPNPFKEGQAHVHLATLQKTLTDKK